MTNAIPWDDTPPPEQGKWLPIFRASPLAPARFFCVGSHIEGVWVHVVDERDRPCLGNADVCDHCRANRNRRWKGYIAVWVTEHSRIMLAEITADAARHSPLDLTPKGPDLRGKQIVLSRLGRHKNSPVRVAFGKDLMGSADLPEDVDVRAALRRIWGLPPQD